VFLGLAVAAGGVLALTKVAATPVRKFEGKSARQWREDLIHGDAAASNRADVVLNTAIIPKLSELALHDTHDSALKLAVVRALNELPGVRSRYLNAPGRRADAVKELGEFGPAARKAVPSLVEILNGNDDATQGAAAEALGEIHSDPAASIPALIAHLENSDIDDDAAESLGKFGPLAKAAVPKLLPLLNGGKEARRAAILALPKIDPETAAKAGITERTLTKLEMDKAARAAAIKAWAAAEQPK
jgi:HEAT repeat protein